MYILYIYIYTYYILYIYYMYILYIHIYDIICTTFYILCIHIYIYDIGKLDMHWWPTHHHGDPPLLSASSLLSGSSFTAETTPQMASKTSTMAPCRAPIMAATGGQDSKNRTATWSQKSREALRVARPDPKVQVLRQRQDWSHNSQGGTLW